MSKLQRVISGNVFIDNFDSATLESRWTVSPSIDSRYSLVERPGYLRIKHAESSTYILTDIPATDTLMFEIKNDYKPAVSNDIGGIIVFKTLADRVELVEYYDPIIDVSRNYLYVRMVKNGDIYDGYGSQDGIVWELIGSARVEDAVKIGLVLNGIPSPLSVNLDIDYVAAYSDRLVYVENLQEGTIARLYSASNVLVKEYTVGVGESCAKFDMFNVPVPFNGYVQIVSAIGLLIDQTPTMTIYPGDEFEYLLSFDVKFARRTISLVTNPATGITTPVSSFVNEVDFILDDISNLGSMDNSSMEGMVTVTNHDNQELKNIEAHIELYKNELCTHTVQLSKDSVGSPVGYCDSIVFTVPANSTYSFWLKITATGINTLSKKDTFKYKLCFKNI